jgi:signal transduction histidine kinase
MAEATERTGGPPGEPGTRTIHELRNEVAAVVMHAELLGLKGEDPQVRERVIESLRRLGRRANELLDRLELEAGSGILPR